MPIVISTTTIRSLWAQSWPQAGKGRSRALTHIQPGVRTGCRTSRAKGNTFPFPLVTCRGPNWVTRSCTSKIARPGMGVRIRPKGSVCPWACPSLLSPAPLHNHLPSQVLACGGQHMFVYWPFSSMLAQMHFMVCLQPHWISTCLVSEKWNAIAPSDHPLGWDHIRLSLVM